MPAGGILRGIGVIGAVSAKDGVSMRASPEKAKMRMGIKLRRNARQTRQSTCNWLPGHRFPSFYQDSFLTIF
jgi:hypothetical protein